MSAPTVRATAFFGIPTKCSLRTSFTSNIPTSRNVMHPPSGGSRSQADRRGGNAREKPSRRGGNAREKLSSPGSLARENQQFRERSVSPNIHGGGISYCVRARVT